jgi:hypothetical protein
MWYKLLTIRQVFVLGFYAILSAEISRPLRMGPLGCAETSVANYQHAITQSTDNSWQHNIQVIAMSQYHQ